MTNPYYHLTDVMNVEAIKLDGLKGSCKPRNRGKKVRHRSIFVMTTDQTKILDTVAINQIWVYQNIERYAIVQIDPCGITGRIVEDWVAERTAPWQRIIRQAVIEPKYLTFRTRRLRWPGQEILRIESDAFLKRAFTPDEWKTFEKYFHFTMIEAQLDFEKRLKSKKKRKQVGRK